MEDVESFLRLGDIIVIQANKHQIQEMLETGKAECTVFGGEPEVTKTGGEG